MILVIITAMAACLAIGYLIGWLIGSDRAEANSYPPVAAPVATQPLRLRLHPSDPDTGELLALDAAETARFPGLAVQPGGAIRIGNMSDPVALAREAGYLASLAAQPRIGELVRASEFIEKMRADTDRWIAANVEGAI